MSVSHGQSNAGRYHRNRPRHGIARACPTQRLKLQRAMLPLDRDTNARGVGLPWQLRPKEGAFSGRWGRARLCTRACF